MPLRAPEIVVVDDVEVEPDSCFDRHQFWDDVESICRVARFSPLLPEIVQGMCAVRAHNEAATMNLTTNDWGRAKTRALFQDLLAHAQSVGFIQAPP